MDATQTYGNTEMTPAEKNAMYRFMKQMVDNSDPWDNIWKAYDEGFCPFHAAAQQGLHIEVPEYYYATDGTLNKDFDLKAHLEVTQMQHKLGV